MNEDQLIADSYLSRDTFMTLKEVEQLKAQAKKVVQEHSSAPTLPTLYRRSWQIIIVPRDKFEGTDDYGETYKDDEAIVLSDSAFGKQALHCKFRVNSSYSVPLYGEVALYNPSQELVNTIVDQGARLIIKAGYQNGPFGTIWNANIYNFIEYRQNVADRILYLYSIAPYAIYQKTFVVAYVTRQENTPSGQLERLTRQYKIPHESKPKEFTEADPNPSPRGAVLSGNLLDLCKDAASSIPGYRLSVADITEKNTLVTAVDPFANVEPGQELVVSPETGLIGTPSSVPMGVSFKTLLDPRLKWRRDHVQVRLKNTEVQVSQSQVGIGFPIARYSNLGVYRIASVTHTGDTRGQDWYSDCMAVVDPSMLVKVGN